MFPKYKTTALLFAGVFSVAFSPVSAFAKDAGGSGGGGAAHASGGGGDAHAVAAPSGAPASVSEAPHGVTPAEVSHVGATPNANRGPADLGGRAVNNAPVAAQPHEGATADAAPAEAVPAGRAQDLHGDRRSDNGNGRKTVIINGYPYYEWYGNYPWYSWVPGEPSPYGYSDDGNDNNPPASYTQQQQSYSPEADTTASGNGNEAGQAAYSANAPAAVLVPTGVATSALQASPDWVKADAAVQQAQAQYDQSSAQVLARLQNDPEYVKAIQARNQSAQQAQRIQPPPQAGVTPQVEGAATKDMDASNRVTQLQADAIAKDQAASAAKARLSDAIAKRDAIARQIAGQAQ